MFISPTFILSALLFLIPSDADAKVYRRQAPLSKETWVKRDVTAPEVPVSFSIALQGEKFHELEARMTQISRTRGDWLKRDELAYYNRPSELSKRHVEDFLASGGVARSEISYSDHEDVLTVRSNSGTVARLFNTRMHDYLHAPTGEILSRGLHYELPNHLDEHVINVRGVSDFVKPHARRAVGSFEGGFKLPQEKIAAKKTTSTKKRRKTTSTKKRKTTSTKKRRTTSTKKKTTSTKKKTTSTKKKTTSTKKRTTSTKKRTTTTKKATTTRKATTTKRATTKTTKLPTTAPIQTFYAQDISFPNAPSLPGQYPPGCIDGNASYACISRMYGTDKYTPTKDIESLAVVTYGIWQNQSVWSFNDLHQPKAPHSYLPNRAYLGEPTGNWEKDITEDDPEAILDAQCMVGIAYGLNLTAYDSSVDYIKTVEALIALPDEDRPGVVSMSYGIQENDVERSYAVDFCKQAQTLASLGTTFVVATGDNGVSINNSTTCPPFAVDLMSSCPYVVGVGGTANFNPERAGYEPSLPEEFNGWSSGGLSGYFEAPAYQKAAVTNYLDITQRKWSEYYNVSGRGFPDVSAYGQAIPIVRKTEDGVHMWLAGGTSASSPIFAGVLALVNAKCKESGKSRVGWMQPTLYAAAVGSNGLKDITKGGSYWCGNYTNPYGFSCEAGWDPSTGLGSPDFDSLVKVFGCE